jgi:hypothetical protein
MFQLVYEDSDLPVKISVVTSERKKTVGTPKRRWEDNIKIDLKEIRCEGVDWIQQICGRGQWRVFVNTVMHLRVS